MLRHPQARSSLEEMTTGAAFQRYIPDPHPDNLVPPNEIRRHILCTGLYSQLGGTAVNIINRIPQVKSTTPSFRSAKIRGSMMWQSAESNKSHLSPTIWSVPQRRILIPTTHITAMKITSHLDQYPNADILWCQVRPPQCIHLGSLFILL